MKVAAMDEQLHHAEVDEDRWTRVFSILSLDMAKPFMGLMGLQLPAGDRFTVELRDFIQRFRLLIAEDKVPVVPFAISALEHFGNVFGAPFSKHLYSWGVTVFQYSAEDGTQAFLWNLILRRPELSDVRDGPDVSRFVHELFMLLRQRPVPSVYDMMPTTPWDLELYSRHGFDRSINPMENVQSTMSYYNFVTTWQDALNLVGSKVNLDEVYSWGLRESRRLAIPPDRLEKPGAWAPLPAPWEKAE
jgi:hypothetical protein